MIIMSDSKNPYDELKYLKQDILNLKKEIFQLKNDNSNRIDALVKNVKCLLKKQDMSWLNKYTCKECAGFGVFYISPLCDHGQSNQCKECHGKGFVWI